MDNNRGFTLLEMLLVIFLISIIVGISAVVFTRSLPSQKVDAAAREIMASFRQARSNAVTSGKWQVLNIDIEGRTFGIEGGARRALPEEVSLRVLDPLYGEVAVGVSPADGTVGVPVSDTGLCGLTGGTPPYFFTAPSPAL